jgi:hypothetical protein
MTASPAFSNAETFVPSLEDKKENNVNGDETPSSKGSTADILIEGLNPPLSTTVGTGPSSTLGLAILRWLKLRPPKPEDDLDAVCTTLR